MKYNSSVYRRVTTGNYNTGPTRLLLLEHLLRYFYKPVKKLVALSVYSRRICLSGWVTRYFMFLIEEP